MNGKSFQLPVASCAGKYSGCSRGTLVFRSACTVQGYGARCRKKQTIGFVFDIITINKIIDIVRPNLSVSLSSQLVDSVLVHLPKHLMRLKPNSDTLAYSC